MIGPRLVGSLLSERNFPYSCTLPWEGLPHTRFPTNLNLEASPGAYRVEAGADFDKLLCGEN